MSAQTGQAVDPNPLIGQSIGKYRIVKLLGQGGMGAVFEAQHETINQRVAIKVLHKKLTSDETSVQRFLHEARTTSLVHHPGLVKVHDFGQLPDGAAYMMMEYLDGESLKSRLSARGKLDSRDALRIVRQLAAALAVAHEKGVIHRDIKPWNFPLLDLPKFLRGEFRGNTAQLIPRFSRRVNKKIPDGTFGIGLQVRQIHWDFLAYRRYCALL